MSRKQAITADTHLKSRLVSEQLIPEALRPRCLCGTALRMHRLDENDPHAYVACPSCKRRYAAEIWPHLEDEDWRLARPGEHCRRIGVGGRNGRKACPAEAVVAFRRAHKGSTSLTSWWAYCAEHTYGRVVYEGQVWWAPQMVDESRPAPMARRSA